MQRDQPRWTKGGTYDRDLIPFDDYEPDQTPHDKWTGRGDKQTARQNLLMSTNVRLGLYALGGLLLIAILTRRR